MASTEKDTDYFSLLAEKVARGVIEQMSKHVCPLNEIGIDEEEHKRHHYVLREFISSDHLEEHRLHHTFLRSLIVDGKKIGIGFILAIFTVLGGGLLTLIWLGFKAKVAGQ